MRLRLEKESPWWVPEPIDDRVFNKIFGGVQRFLADVRADPEHEVRASIETACCMLAERLRNDPVMIAKAEEVKQELLSHPEVQAWTAVAVGRAEAGDARARPTTRAASCAAG